VLFPIQSLLRSLLLPCSCPVTNWLHSRKIHRKTRKIEILTAWGLHSASIFPVFFPVNGNLRERRVRSGLHPPPDSPQLRESFSQLSSKGPLPGLFCILIPYPAQDRNRSAANWVPSSPGPHYRAVLAITPQGLPPWGENRVTFLWSGATASAGQVTTIFRCANSG
jgi:hypothetical protein